MAAEFIQGATTDLASESRLALPGSDRHEIRFHGVHAELHPDERHEVSLITAGHLTEGELDTLQGFAADHGLVVVAHDRVRRRLVLSGRTAAMESAFGVSLHRREHESGSYCSHHGPVTVPTEILRLVEGVFGLDNRPLAKPYFRVLPDSPRHAAGAKAHWAIINQWVHDATKDQESYPQAQAEARAEESAAFRKPPGTFTPVDLARIYGFPPGDGAGQTIALIELGGGYNAADFNRYADENGLPRFKVSSVSVDHGRNRTGSDADGEVALDIEVAAAVAPGAKIVCYFGPNTDQGFIDCVSAAVHDKTNKPSVISISWGAPESEWSPAAINSLDKVFQEASAAGITVLVASGDNGSSDGVDDGIDHVDFPASSPNVCACGGTKLIVNGSDLNETVWNEPNDGAGGGGFSKHFPVPAWQKHEVPAGTTGRGVPDVAGNADPLTGFPVFFRRKDQVLGGTSAISPLVAGLIARINQKTGKRIGHICLKLYANPSICRDITAGSNGSFKAAIGWDAASGLGVIDGQKLLASLSPDLTSHHYLANDSPESTTATEAA